MNAASRKLRMLEANVLEKPKLGTTKLCTCSMPVAEAAVLNTAREIAVSNVPFEHVTVEQREVLDKALELLHFRVLDLFTTYMVDSFCGDCGTAKVFFYQQFFKFMHETTEKIKQLKKKT